MTKHKYRFLLRPLAGDVTTEFQKVEAGPFTPAEAAMFGHAETARYALRTGEPFVCDCAPIVDKPRIRSPLSLRGLLVVVACVLVGYIVGYLLARGL